ncbi:MAG: hypothetical protein WCB31_05600 [Nitrososphaeraceae archaeon]
MAGNISGYTKSSVIHAWLTGKIRDSIAVEHNISSGTVSNIIREWKIKIGYNDADSPRDLAIGIKKAETSPQHCVSGLRILNLVNQFGMDEEHVQDFLNKIYRECQAQHIHPSDVARLAKVINAFPEIKSIKEIPRHIKERFREKIKLDRQIDFLKHEIENLNRENQSKRKEIQDLQNDSESFKQKNRNEQKDFLLFKDLKNELHRNNISIQNVEQLINVIRIFKDDFDFQPIEIVNELSSMQNYRYQCDNKKRELKEIESSIQISLSYLDNYNQYISSYQKEEYALTELQNMDFNLIDFTKMYCVLQDIALKYQIDKKEVKTKFFKLLDKFTDLFLVEIEIAVKQNEVFVLDNDIISRREILKAQPEIFSGVKCLLESGLGENNILSMFQIINKDLLNRIPEDVKDYLEDLSKDLDKYKTVKDTLKSLNIKEVLMKSRVDRLSAEKSNLEFFILPSVIIYYFYCILVRIKHVQMKKKVTEIFCAQYVFYLLLYSIAKENSLNSREKLHRKKQERETFKGEKRI